MACNLPSSFFYRVQLFLQHWAKYSLRQSKSFLASVCTSYLLLFTADPWSLSSTARLTLIAQQCCGVVLRRDFLCWERGSVWGLGNNLSSFPEGRLWNQVVHLLTWTSALLSHFAASGCFLTCLTSEDTSKVKQQQLSPATLPTSSVSCSLETKNTLPFIAVQGYSGALCCSPCGHSCSPSRQLSHLSHSQPWA